MSKIVIRGEPSRLGITSHKSTQKLAQEVGINPGNLAFSYASALICGFPRNVTLIEAPSKDEKIGVFTLANYLGEHYNPSHFQAFLERAPDDWRAVVLGLGAQGLLDRLTLDPGDVTLSEGHLSWMRALRDRSGGRVNVSVRGDLTYKLLDRYGLADNVVVTGCPSLMLSPARDLGHVVARKFAALGSDVPLLNGTLGNPWDPRSQPFEQALIRQVAASGGLMHVQMQLDHLRLARGDALDEQTMRMLNRQLMPHLSLEEFQRTGRRHFHVWWDVPAWMEHLTRADFVIGTRIHGTALALQAGTPALCVAWDSRTYELCRSMNIPYVSIYDEPWRSGQFDWALMRESFAAQFDADTFDRNRLHRAQQFVELLKSNEVPPSPHLVNLATPVTVA
ncbi:Polysaccharide pyruvyl transferase [Sphingobium sp. AP50]|uniref:polysaccharide pyruvyl transferase family protein n=1 Tax=Sphingobium sp. AP50 TaxID=1884369 RepID=UPI0008BE9023|nr:polysaccharide pyruvyl transferase family protein [Sphingobium sp. AP50]SEJ78638.1 Polysaccharide pyruvyl transferase [Sphingobium sp. AP50]